MKKPLEYEGKTALVTGSARGIGLTIARRLAQEGARVIIADVNRAAGEQAVEGMRKDGLAADFIFADLSVAGGPTSMVQASAKLTGHIDVLVNNARAGRRLCLLEESEQNWDLALNVGLKAAFFASQTAIKIMAEKPGGSIVNVASVAAVLATNESPSYHAAKAGILQLTRYLAIAASTQRVRVNCVLPGLIVQEEHRARFESTDNETYRKTAAFYQPLGEVGTENDIADAVLYLCSAGARYVSGACLVIDGGATVQEQFGMLLRWREEQG